jgi:hypothetical protein
MGNGGWRAVDGVAFTGSAQHAVNSDSEDRRPSFTAPSRTATMNDGRSVVFLCRSTGQGAAQRGAVQGVLRESMACFILDLDLLCAGSAAARLTPRSHRRRLSASDGPGLPSSGPLPAACGLSSHSDPGLAASPLSRRPREPEQPHPRSKPSPHPHTAVLCCFLSFATSTCTSHLPL